MKSSELIFVPAPGAGHMVSTLEFASRLLDKDDQLLITVLIMKFPFTSFVDSYTKSFTASRPRIQLIDIPEVEPPPSELSEKSIEAYICKFIESLVPLVKDIVADIISSRSSSGTVRVAGLVLDLFCVSMIDVADELGIPSFIFFTCNTGFLGLMMYFCHHFDQVISTEFRISGPDMLIPGFANPVPQRVLPGALFNKHGGCAAFVNIGKRFKDARGILVNTCAELEPYAIDYFLNDASTPRVYPVGPVLSLKSQPNPDFDPARWDKIKEWLDKEPQSSVVFLCFGSWGSFSAPQVKEIALGLEQSGQKFLWSMRVPPSSEFKNPEEMLPEGFLGRTERRGMICGWASQVEILAHKAIGGFVSHCGWNSIMESLWHGIPIATFPIYAEQQLNAFVMAKELGLAVELKLDFRRNGDIVMADEIARAVNCVMQSDSLVRKKVKESSDIIRKAITDGGSSSNFMAQFVKDVVGSS